MNKKYLSETITLLDPIETIQAEKPHTITVVTVKPFSTQELIDLMPKAEQITTPEMFEFVKASTGLTDDEIDELCTMDWNKIYKAVYKFYITSAHALAKKKLDPSDRKAILYFSENRVVNFKLPKVKITKLAEEMPNVVEQHMFIISNITNLEMDELKAMPVPDYRTLSEVVTYFLDETAD